MISRDFEFIATLLKDRSGIVLTPDKTYLLEGRLMPVARKHGLASLDDLAFRLRTQRDELLVTEVVDAMTTNESFFFRDTKPFDIFRETVLPGLVAARRSAKRSRLRIWSAACSTGQEPYSLAMILKENPHLWAGLEIEIVATDLSTQALGRARAGRYTQFEVQRGMPIQLLIKYFAKVEDHWEVAPAIRQMVQFRPFNLLESYAALGRFDIVFCRNVLIYFDQPTKATILERTSAAMEDDGVLFLGGAETVLGITSAFQAMPGLRGAYANQPKAARAAAPGAPRVAGAA